MHLLDQLAGVWMKMEQTKMRELYQFLVISLHRVLAITHVLSKLIPRLLQDVNIMYLEHALSTPVLCLVEVVMRIPLVGP